MWTNLGVQEVSEEVLVVPRDSRLAVGLRVRETGSLARLATGEAVQVGTLLVAGVLLNGVALEYKQYTHDTIFENTNERPTSAIPKWRGVASRNCANED